MILLLGAALAASPIRVGEPYLLDVVVVSSAAVPILGETNIITRSLLLAEFEESDGQITQTQHLCAVQVSDDARLSDTVIPPAFIANFPVQRYPVSVDPEGDGWRYVADPGQVSVGYRPAPALPIPQEPDDARVFDWDRDGKPGATVFLVVPVLGDVEIYVAQLGHTLFNGAVSESGAVRGAVSIAAFDQHTIGASNALFHASPPVTQVPSRSFFQLTPLQGQDCAAVLKQAGPPGG